MLKTQQEGDILRINAETEKKIIFLTKDNERIQGEIDSKKKEMEERTEGKGEKREPPQKLWKSRRNCHEEDR